MVEFEAFQSQKLLKTPVTMTTKARKSQTDLMIEY